MTLEMGRWAMDHGRPNDAEILYGRIPAFGDDWHTGLALYDLSLKFIKEGKHSEARRLLTQPGVKERGGDIEIGLLSLLAASYLRTGEVEIARQTAQKSLDLYGSRRSRDERLQSQIQRSKQILIWCLRYESGQGAQATEIGMQ
jgi:hypothetical protein